MFRDFFTCGLRFIPSSFFRDVLEEFNVQLHQLTPNGIAVLSKFAWACKSYGAAPDIDSFCSFYELQKQPKKTKEGLICQYDSCSFFPQRKQAEPRLEISYYQKNKWEKEWLSYWFYVRTPGYVCTEFDGKVTCYPFASAMTPMKPITSVTPPTKVTSQRVECNKAFALACRYFGGRDVIEKMVAANYWPLAKNKAEFCLENVALPVFGPPEGVPFPRFGLKVPADR